MEGVGSPGACGAGFLQDGGGCPRGEDQGGGGDHVHGDPAGRVGLRGLRRVKFLY